MMGRHYYYFYTVYYCFGLELELLGFVVAARMRK